MSPTIPSRAKAEAKATAAEAVEACRKACDLDGMIEGDRQDHRTEADVPRPQGDRRHDWPEVEGPPALRLQGPQVHRADQDIEAQHLGFLRQPKPILPGDALLRLDVEPDFRHDLIIGMA
jgi:hypothetical protein